MADVTIYFEGYDSITQTYNSGGYNQDIAFTGLPGSVGSVTILHNAAVALTGVAATTSVGTVQAGMPTNVVYGWDGTQSWGNGGWGETGIPVLTSSLGSVTASGAANSSVTGIAATGSVGTVGIQFGQVVPVTGISATASVGSVVAGAGITFSVTGVSATSPIYGGWGTSSEAWGEGAWGGVVVVSEGAGINVTVTGIAATSGIGSVTVSEGAGITFSVTGIAASCLVNSVDVDAGTGVSVEVTGVEGTVPAPPGVLIWSVVDTSQTPNWIDIAA